MNPSDSDASRFKSASPDRRGERDLDDLLVHVARGDQEAFEAVYDRLVGPAYGVIRRVLRDPSQSEEVTQEVLLEVWRTAARFDPAMGGAATWVMIIAHRRAIDRVRSTMAATEREHKTAEINTPHDEVAEAVEASLDRERVRRCLDGLTEVQRESITLAYYGGYSYRQVADLLKATLGAIKTRIRDGLIRMRDCLGVS
jgi:RNA polymerase sigma-70 factor (ECF subfamily)